MVDPRDRAQDYARQDRAAEYRRQDYVRQDHAADKRRIDNQRARLAQESRAWEARVAANNAAFGPRRRADQPARRVSSPPGSNIASAADGFLLLLVGGAIALGLTHRQREKDKRLVLQVVDELLSAIQNNPAALDPKVRDALVGPGNGNVRVLGRSIYVGGGILTPYRAEVTIVARCTSDGGPTNQVTRVWQFCPSSNGWTFQRPPIPFFSTQG